VIERTVEEIFRGQLLTPERIELMRKHLAATLASKNADAGRADAGRRKLLATVEKQIANLIAFIKAGTPHPGIAAGIRCADQRARATR
jgi:hypothetical protein